MRSVLQTVESIRRGRDITREQLALLLDPAADPEPLHTAARLETEAVFGDRVFIRGLIEFTNYCKNNCLYCGIRRDNPNVCRYRLETEEILECCRAGYALGFRTFVLQGGEDPYFTDDRVCRLVSAIKSRHPDCAVTLSIGEKSRESYRRYRQAGADRYLLRHETADEAHYASLHPGSMKLSNRLRCLRDLKAEGYQVGCGFMVGSPGQTMDTLYRDLRLIVTLRPHMVGIGPFIPQKDTPFAGESGGTAEQTVRLLSIIRLLHPTVLLPSTTALGTIDPRGREKGILAGGNVVMPNLSPRRARENYNLYDGKLHSGKESAEGLRELEATLQTIGRRVCVDRGDSPDWPLHK